MMRDSSQAIWKRAALYFLAACCSAAGIVLIKLSAPLDIAGSNSQELLAAFPWGAIAGLAIYLAGIFLGIILVKTQPVSEVYPSIVGLSLILLAVLSIFLLKEQITLYKGVGSLLVILGVFILNPRQ